MSEGSGERRWQRLIRFPFRGRAGIAADVDEEFRFHLDRRAEELRARGLEPLAARDGALGRFGDLNDARRYCVALDARVERGARRRTWFGDIAYDLKHALRQLRRAPGVSLVVIVTLALGIGATTAIFSAVRHLLIDPIPVPGGDRIYAVSRVSGDGSMFITPRGEAVAAWRRGATSFEHLGTFTTTERTLSASDAPENLIAGEISADVMPLLGVRPLLGRAFTNDDARNGAAAVTILGHGFWKRRFGGDPRIVGQTISLDGRPFTVIGVMPRNFSVPFLFGETARIWLPLSADPSVVGARAIAKLRPGVTRESAERELSEIMRSDPVSARSAGEWKPIVRRPQDYLGTGTRDTLLVLLGAVGLVLLIACANVANVLLARAVARRREFVIRAALGAGSGRVVRQVLAESALLSVAGGVLGLLIAWGGLGLIVRIRPQQLAALDEVRMNPEIVAFALAISLVTGILFGLAPAIFATGRRLQDPLRSSSRSSTAGAGAGRARRALVVAEMSLSVVLLVAAGLLVRTLVAMQQAPLGFDPSGLTRAWIILPAERYTNVQQRTEAFGEILRRVRGIPGVEAATWSMGVPPDLGITIGTLELEGRPAATEGNVTLQFNAVTPEYFGILKNPIRAGRPLSDRDSAAREVMVSESMARRQWPGESAVGQRLRLSSNGPWNTVVGVVADVTLPSTGGAPFAGGQVYYTRFNAGFEEATLVVRQTTGAPGLATALVRVAEAVDPMIRVREVNAVGSLVQARFAKERFNGILLTAFAVTALVLAGVGLYGVVAYSVSQRVREMGIRLALGARPRAVMRLVLLGEARLTILGVVLGLLAATAVTGLLRGMLYAVEPTDPLTFVSVGVALLAIALVAAWVPARRAMHVDPVVALRGE
ncbi:MAG TPA: ABC transporter permease [Gemmatimonadaceae bacterium]|nr:ABC transporter permease [Gemmatimonadaceae bacterium]